MDNRKGCIKRRSDIVEIKIANGRYELAIDIFTLSTATVMILFTAAMPILHISEAIPVIMFIIFVINIYILAKLTPSKKIKESNLIDMMYWIKENSDFGYYYLTGEIYKRVLSGNKIEHIITLDDSILYAFDDGTHIYGKNWRDGDIYEQDS